ncbi:LysR family transcriptional regulator [Rhizobium sp. CG5]|uniref:LysR family transcriptional regulator n=1 Tax=Rhizobium sp. CG5 TaxID=2726076 RepID=UPI00203408B0|nr:LysR family transcriptional regulator [Rhizobium sp. CG5]MCM2477240.1 LysR family transcriptional regulator [Rhizobium sp. CG5]
MITLKQIEAFHCVARLGGIGKAAERLNTTESTISKRLQEFELALQIDVFERAGRSLTLSPTGRRILLLCEKMLDTRTEIMEATALSPSQGSILRLGITELVSALYLEKMLEEFGARFPGVQVDPTVGLNDFLVDGLRHNTLDLIVCPSLPMRAGEFKYIILTESRSKWMCSPKLLPQGKIDTIAELAKLPLILQPRASRFHEMLIDFFQQRGLYPSRILTASNLAGLRDFAAAGLGAAALPPAFCRAELASGRLQIIRTPYQPPSLQYAVFHNRTTTSPLIIQAATVVSEIIGESAFQ